jgi:predicted RNA-binding Zn-ribbon protein involved in translation (DUF1610 family)
VLKIDPRFLPLNTMQLVYCLTYFHDTELLIRLREDVTNVSVNFKDKSRLKYSRDFNAERPDLTSFNLTKIDKYINIRMLLRMLGYEFKNEVKIKARTAEYPCRQCDKIYRSERGLREHKKVVHEGVVRVSDPCPYCGKTFAYFHKLKRHVSCRVHGELITTAKELRPNSLKMHISQLHKNDGSLPKCPKCSKRFQNANKLAGYVKQCKKA